MTCTFYLGPRYQGSGDTAPAEILPLTLLGEGNFDFDEFGYPLEQLPYWLKRSRGHVISAYPVLPGILNTPTYAVAKRMGIDVVRRRFDLSHVTSALLCATAAALLYGVVRSFASRPETPALVTATFAFGTCTWSVASRGMWQHAPSLVFLVAAIALLRSSRRAAVWGAGLVAGFAVATRPSNAVLIAPLALYVAAARRNAVAGFLLAAAVPLAALAAYSQVYWGSVLALGQQHRASQFDGVLVSGLAGVLTSPARGLFVFTPVLVFAVAPMVRSLVRRDADPLLRALAAGVVLLTLVVAQWRVWWGGISFGYRLLIETLPAWMVFLAIGWEAAVARSRVRTAVFLTLVALSGFIHFLGSYYYPSGFNRQPDHIDSHPARLWEVRDTELVRCFRAFVAAHRPS